MKNLLKWFAISLLVAFVLTASLQPPARCAAKAMATATTCGSSVYGHTVSGEHSRELCPEDGKVMFISGDHVYSQGLDVCPLDGTPMINGHSTAGGD